MSGWCTECGAFYLSRANHYCGPRWRVWCEADGESADDARVVYASDPEDAAERYAQLECEHDPECYESYLSESSDTLSVQSVDGGEVYRYDVRGEQRVEFFARRAES